MLTFPIGTPRHMVGHEATGGKEDEILYILHSVGAKRFLYLNYYCNYTLDYIKLIHRCSRSSTSCPAGCSAKGTYNGIPPEAPESVEQREHIENMLATTSRQAIGLFGTSANLNRFADRPPE